MEVLGQVKSKAMRLMNAVEDAFLTPLNYPKWIICDAILVAVYLFPEFAITKSRLYHGTVELSGHHTRGQMVLDHKRKDEGNTRVIMHLHKDNYKQIISWMGGLIDDEEFLKLVCK